VVIAESDVPEHARDPVAVVTALVRQVEPQLSAGAIEDAFVMSVKVKPARRRLAAALAAEPDLLTSGRPAVPVSIQRFMRALLDAGAFHVVLPRCAHCSGQKPLRSLDGDLRICAYCAMLKAAAADPCSGCGDNRHVATRDGNGRALCQRCKPAASTEPADELYEMIQAIEPGMPRAVVLQAINETLAKPMHVRQAIWALQEQPEALTGAVVPPTAKVGALIKALVNRGARVVAAAPCSRCGAVEPLPRVVDGRRCCRRCYDDTVRGQCGRCGRRNVRIGALRHDGSILCHPCHRGDPLNFECCTNCSTEATIVRRTATEHLCARCFRTPIAICSVCDRARPCWFARTDGPICANCSVRRRAPEACSRCSRVSLVVKRLADGAQLCRTCGAIREQCFGCYKVRAVSTRLSTGESLCQHCARSHPELRRPCVGCGATTNPYRWGLCPQCAQDRTLRAHLGDAEGQVPARLRPLFDTLRRGAALPVLWWLRRADPRRVLTAIADADQPLSHELLDTLRPFMVVRHLRAALVVEGVLPQRDEQLTRLEQWIPVATARIADPSDRRVVRAFATWHHLRRLRADSRTRPVTFGQAAVARKEIRVAVQFVVWLHERGLTLAGTGQDDVERWLDGGGSQRRDARAFLTWAARRHHVPTVEIPLLAPEGPTSFIEHDHRWELARRLITDDTLEPGTRVIGLLVLLYAQPLSRIMQLRVEDVAETSDQVMIALGLVPAVLPPPLDDLIRTLLTRRHGHAVIGRTDDNPWLFPGEQAGQPMSARHAMRRLQAFDTRARPARNTTLMELAAELPAVVLSRLLGLSINSATKWTRGSTGHRAAYAATVARRRGYASSAPTLRA
jgi:hypothetical protein